MGADMALAIARAPHYATGVDPQPSETLATIGVRRLAAIDWDSAAEDIGWRLDPELDEDSADITGRLPGLAAEAVNAVLHPRRDIAVVTIADQEYFATGGLSWGDPPTDIFDQLDAVDALGVWDAEITAAEVAEATS